MGKGGMRRIALSSSLPEDALTSGARVTMIGRGCVLVEGQRGVVELGGGRIRLKTPGGMLSVLKGECHLLATTFEWADAIDAERAARSKARAEEILAQKNLDKRDLELAEARLKRALVRSSVVARKDI